VKKVKIKSVYLTRFGRRDDDLVAITLEAVRGAVEGRDIGRISDIYLASYAPGELCDIADPFRMLTLAIQAEYPAMRATYHGLYKTGGAALFGALTDASPTNGTGERLVVGSEKMTHLAPGTAAGILAARDNEHDRSYGATLPALGALVTRVYMHTRGVPETALHWVATKNHQNGALNPKAHFQKRVTLDEVAASPLVADPLRRYHCAPTSDGAAAVLLSPTEGEACFRGWARGLDVPLFQDRDDLGRFLATARAAEEALAVAGVERGDIDIVEIHDAFAPFELMNLEDMGFYRAGTAWKALEAGKLDIGGVLAVNTSGGMKAKGHPIGATGLSSTVEIHEQLTQQAGPRQHPGARMGMIQSAGGVSPESYVFVIDTV